MTENNRFGFSGLSEDARRTRRLFQAAGVGYGLLFGLGFALFAWGYDAYVLYQSGGVLPWSKLVIGLPLALVVGGLAGWLAALTQMTVVSVVVWALVCGLLGASAGHIPFEGGNLVIWFVDQRYWGETIFHFLSSAATRTTLMVFIMVLLGALVGFIESLVLQWAWDRSSPDGRMTFSSWLTVSAALPMALLPALVVNGFLHRPLNTPQRLVSETLDLALSGVREEQLTAESLQSSYRSVKPYLDKITEGYETHFVSFSSETGTWYSAYIEAVFLDGFVIRCVTVGDRLVYCDDFAKRVAGWVDQLVNNALYEERPWLDAKMRRLDVDESVIDWLAEHRDQISENYEVGRESQQSSWVYTWVRFDTGFEMVCRFRDVQPTVVDQCYEVSNTAQ